MCKTAELKNTKTIVKAILEEDYRARNSDSYLYFKVLEFIKYTINNFFNSNSCCETKSFNS